MRNEYYLPLNSTNISQYFSRGIVMPSKYIEGWINDIQSKNNSIILLCSRPLTNESSCSITIVFTNDELSEIEQISDNFFVYGKPLPIARIKSLNFKDEQQSKTTIYNIEKGDAFIPKLISIVNKDETIDVSELSSAKNIDFMQDWKEKIDLYNQVLGGFAVMRIADIKVFDYPKNYFKCFSIINKEVESQIRDLNFNQDYAQYINISDKKASAYGKINPEFVTAYAKKYENFVLPVNKRSRVIRFDEIDENKNSYIFSILATYGADIGKIKKISDFIFALVNDKFHPKSREKLCLTFGINQGYSAFRNQYNIGKLAVNTKFELNSEVDYTIIESVYQYVFNNKADNTSFPYIREWCPKFNNTIDTQKYETYRIFDKVIAYKKKVQEVQFGSKEYLLELYQRFSENSMLAPIFSLFKEQVQNSIQTTVETIFNKVKSDAELELNNKQFTSEENDLQKKIADLTSQNKKLINQIEKSSQSYYSFSNVEESSVNYGLKIGIDKNAVINKHRDTLEKITSIGELKGIAKYYGIKSISRFKNNEEDKKTLRKLILEKEEKLLS